MKVLHLTLMAFCQALITAIILYSNLVSALPVAIENNSNVVLKQKLNSGEKHAIEVNNLSQPDSKLTPKKDINAPVVVEGYAKKPVEAEIAVPVVVSNNETQPLASFPQISIQNEKDKKVSDAETIIQYRSVEKVIVESIKPAERFEKKDAKLEQKTSSAEIPSAFSTGAPIELTKSQDEGQAFSSAEDSAYQKIEGINKLSSRSATSEVELKQASISSQIELSKVEPQQVKQVDEKKIIEPKSSDQLHKSAQAQHKKEPASTVSQQPSIPVHQSSVRIEENIPVPVQEVGSVHFHELSSNEKSAQLKIEPHGEVVVIEAAKVKQSAPATITQLPITTVNGGLGPLNLLAETLCNSQPERLIASDELTALYNKRATLRKSLFDLMSLKFTNLEKLSSRLSFAAGKPFVLSPSVNVSQPLVSPSHGWPVVGKCTAHDLRLMAEAAWCEERVEALESVRTPRFSSPSSSVEQSSAAVFSKILHVVSSPSSVSSTVSSQAVPSQVQEGQQENLRPKTLECRRKALRLAKSLFNHLAEDQKEVSESWPRLYSALAEDECARKRVVDIVSALSNFRGESSSTIRRDNVEYAFAMDDLRPKVLESEVTAPLTFDRQFIEVEQFLQQSVKLLMSNIDPERAKLTQLRYRSLMAGPVSVDDQCVELHQRLLAKSYPSDCNPNQLGQIADVLRMTALSLELWSVETELVKAHTANAPPQTLIASPSKLLGLPEEAAPQTQQALKECITSLVVS